MAEQVPSVGRMVHYVAYGSPGGEYQAGAHRAATITDVYPKPGAQDPAILSSNVGLIVFNPTGIHFREQVPYDPSGETPGTWHWPERV